MVTQGNRDAALDRAAIESCFLDVVRAVSQREMSGADECVLGALFTAGAIHSALEHAVAANDLDETRARLTTLLAKLQQLVSEWRPDNRRDITDALFALGEAKATA